MHEKYFEEAAKQARMAKCERALCGSVVVSADNKIIGRGFNAPPLSDESQRMCSSKLDRTIKTNNDKTCCVHAEWNAILDALSSEPVKTKGSTLYFMRVNDRGEYTQAGEPYCTVCSRLALQAGVSVFGLWNSGPEMIDTNTYNKMSYDYFR